MGSGDGGGGSSDAGSGGGAHADTKEATGGRTTPKTKRTDDRHADDVFGGRQTKLSSRCERTRLRGRIEWARVSEVVASTKGSVSGRRLLCCHVHATILVDQSLLEDRMDAIGTRKINVERTIYKLVYNYFI